MDEDQRLMMTGLGGCTQHIIFPDKFHADMAITALTTCVPHHGVHHFAVTDEGLGLHFSRSGYDCLRRSVLFRDIMPELEPV